MFEIKIIQLKIIPIEAKFNHFIPPYVVRGFIMDGLKTTEEGKVFVEQLHQKMPKNTPLYYAPYRIAFLPKSPPSHEDIKDPPLFELSYQITCLDTTLFQLIFNHLTTIVGGNIIYLGKEQAIIAEMGIKQVKEEDLLKEVSPVKSISLAFKTPTSFADRNFKQYYLLPSPSKIFWYLAKFWNCLAGDTYQINPAFQKWIWDSVFVGQYCLKTAAVHWGKPVPLIGFKGIVRFTIHNKHPIFTRWLGILTEFGALVGVGEQRTIGFGTYEIINIEKESNAVMNFLTADLTITAESPPIEENTVVETNFLNEEEY